MCSLSSVLGDEQVGKSEQVTSELSMADRTLHGLGREPRVGVCRFGSNRGGVRVVSHNLRGRSLVSSLQNPFPRS